MRGAGGCFLLVVVVNMVEKRSKVVCCVYLWALVHAEVCIPLECDESLECATALVSMK